MKINVYTCIYTYTVSLSALRVASSALTLPDLPEAAALALYTHMCKHIYRYLDI